MTEKIAHIRLFYRDLDIRVEIANPKIGLWISIDPVVVSKLGTREKLYFIEDKQGHLWLLHDPDMKRMIKGV